AAKARIPSSTKSKRFIRSSIPLAFSSPFAKAGPRARLQIPRTSGKRISFNPSFHEKHGYREGTACIAIGFSTSSHVIHATRPRGSPRVVGPVWDAGERDGIGRAGHFL